MDVTTEAGALFGSNPQHKDKVLLINIIIISLYLGCNLDNAAHQTQKQTADAVKRENKRYRSSFPLSTPSFLLFCRHVGRLAT